MVLQEPGDDVDVAAQLETLESDQSQTYDRGWVSLACFRQTLESSFSAVSTPIFASKYAFFSIFRDLQDLQSFAPLQTKKIQKISSTFLVIFAKFEGFFANSCQNSSFLCRFFSEFHQVL